MTEQQNIKPAITLFLSTCMTLPVVQMLIERDLLAGVVITPRMDADSMQLEQNLIHFQVPTVRYDPAQIEQVKSTINGWNSNLGLIATFSVLLPEEIISLFEFGIYNVHGSPLPKYRGANPVFWQLKNNETESAIVIHKVEKGMDDGAIVFTHTVKIHPQDTFGSLSNMIYHLMPIVIQELLKLFEKHNGHPPLELQQGDRTKAPMPVEQDIEVDWHQHGADEIVALSRACNPVFGGARIRWKEAVIGLAQAGVVVHPCYGVPVGTILHIGAPEGLIVATKDKAISVDILHVMDGVFTGLQFAQRFSLNAGEKFS